MFKKHKFSILFGVVFALLITITTSIILWQKPDLIQRSSKSVSMLINKQLNKHSQDQKPTFGAQSYHLDNGLQIVVIPNHRAPVITHMIWYKVGAGDEAPGQSGIVHFLEHLMFKGSKNMAPGEFSKTIKKLGGHDNAFTTQDYTAYYQTIAKEHLHTVMSMEAERMVNLHPPLEQVQSERKVILEERSQRIDNSPVQKFQEHLRAIHFINHPYGIPTIGWRHEMEQLTWDIADQFHRRYYRPDNAIIVVSGDVTGDEVLTAAKETYGQIPKPSAPLPSKTWTQSPPLTGQTTLNYSDPDIKQTQLYMLFSAPNHGQSKSDALALELLQDILGGGPTSILYKKLVIDHPYATSVSVSYNSAARSTAQFWISATLHDGVQAQHVKQLILDTLTSIADQGIDKDKLKTAIQKARDSAIFARDSLDGPAIIFGSNLATGATLDDIEYWQSDIESVTEKQIQSVAQRFLSPNTSNTTRMSIGILSPPRKATETDQGIDAKNTPLFSPSAPIAVPVDQ